VRRSGVSLLVLCLAAAGGVRSSQAQQRVERDVVYGWHSGTALLMDVHYPARQNGVAVIWINGSGFQSDPGRPGWQLKTSQHMWVAQPYLDAGFTLFTINHRALPAFRFPDALHDAQRAVRFVRHHAPRFGIDPDRVAARGSSSGGHLTALLGTLDGAGDTTGPDPVDHQPAKVRAVIALRASYDFTTSPAWRPELVEIIESLLGASLAEAPARYADASPQTHLTPDDAAFLIVHGDADQVIPFDQATAMRDALVAAGVAHDFVHLPEAGHGWPLAVYDESHAAAWLTEQMFGPTRAAELQPLFAAHRRLAERWGTIDPDDIDGALALVGDMVSDPSRPTVPGLAWNRICWRGATRARAAEVITACDRAVEAEPDEAEYRDSRGLARALLGDTDGAIEDFEFFLRHATDERRHQRRHWVTDLRAGRSPFSAEVLAELRGGA